MRSLLLFFFCLTPFAVSNTVHAQTWQRIGPRTQGSIKRIHFDSKGTIIAVGNHLQLSSDDGRTWQYVMRDGAPVKPSDFAVDSNDNYLVVVEGERLSGFTASDLLRSSDFGLHWEVVSDTSYTVVPSRSAYYVGTWGGLNVSTDRGSTWTFRTVMSYPTIVDRNGAAYGFALDSLYRSADNGMTWDKFVSPGQIAQIAVVGESIYATTTTGVYKNRIGSQIWGRMAFPSVFDYFRVAQIEGDTMYASCPQLVFRSFDHGDTWSHFDQDLPFNLNIQEMVQDKSGRLYLATYDGIYRHTPGTASVTKAMEDNATLIVASQGRISIRNLDGSSGQLTVVLYDVLGREVLSSPVEVNGERADVQIPMTLRGSFFVRVLDQDHRPIGVQTIIL